MKNAQDYHEQLEKKEQKMDELNQKILDLVKVAQHQSKETIENQLEMSFQENKIATGNLE